MCTNLSVHLQQTLALDPVHMVNACRWSQRFLAVNITSVVSVTEIQIWVLLRLQTLWLGFALKLQVGELWLQVLQLAITAYPQAVKRSLLTLPATLDPRRCPLCPSLVVCVRLPNPNAKP